MASSSESALKLIERVYDAAIDASLWPETLLALTDAVGGAQAMMGVHNVPERATSVIAPRMAPEHLAEYCDHWGQGDILWHRTNKAPIGQVLQAERFVPRDEFLRTPIYNEWHRPAGIGAAGLGVNLFVEGGVPALCGIKRPSHRDEFSADEIAIFTVVAPHLVRAVEIHRRLHRLELTRTAVHNLGNDEHRYVILVDAAQRPMEVDGAAKQVLDAKDGLCLENSRLAASDPTISAVLKRLIGNCICPDQGNVSCGGSVTIPRGQQRPPLHVDVAPIHARHLGAHLEWLGRAKPVAVIAVTDPERKQALDRERLGKQFELTPAETNLALEIAKGDGRQAAATRLGITVGTVRTHLTRVFDKTGVRRQAELARLVLKVAGNKNG